jgi:DNA-binding response OmpR family regulator
LGRILVVDDNADMRAYLQRLLSGRWEVEAVGGGDAALEAARRLPPNLILADVVMPGPDGFDLIQRLRQEPQLQHTPVILLTARTGEEAAIRGLLGGADDYIAKPFSPRELVARIQMAVERARAEAALHDSQAELLRELDATRQLQTISSLLIEEGSDEGLYERILDVAIAIMQSDFGSIQLLDAERGELRLLAWRNFHPDAAEFWQKVSTESGAICGAALSHGQRVIVPNVHTAASLQGSENLRYYALSDIRAVQSTPLMTRQGRLVGMISTHWRVVHTPGERELRLLDILARQAADFIERRAQDELLTSEKRPQDVLETDALPRDDA